MSNELTDQDLKRMWAQHAPNIGGIFDFAREVIAADRAKRRPMTPDAWQNPLHPDQLSDKPIPNWMPLYRLMSKISNPENADVFSADAAAKAFNGVKT